MIDNMARRQSSPRPTPAEELQRQSQRQAFASDPATASGGAVSAKEVLDEPIGREAVQKAMQVLLKYKAGKANLERRIVENEQWYKLRHWEHIEKKETGQVEPTSAWLFNAIENKLADAMDNFPSPNVLPREEGDKAEAEMLSSILPVILDQCDFEQVYEEVSQNKLKAGTGVYGVFWDASKLNGMGDISIRKVDIINLFWEPGITDIQKSRNLFYVTLEDNDTLIAKYPQLQGKLSTPTVSTAKYLYDDSVDTTDKSAVIDWYYKKRNAQGKDVLHFCKYCNDVVLYATENDRNVQTDMMGQPMGLPTSERGLYDHGKYPFFFDALFRVEGTPAGFGYIDVGKSAQEYIDRGNQAIMENMLVNAKPRYFARSDGAVNETEFADMTKDIVHVDGNLGQDSIQPIQGAVLPTIYFNVLNGKVDELKETTGNRDISTGGTSSGVTAASAIAAMQEAGSKLSRLMNQASYRVFRHICLVCIELIRQFYDMPRCFRIMGEDGAMRFVQYSNAGLAPQYQGNAFGVDMGMRTPLFDINVTAQKQSPYSKMSQNELSLQLYQAGLFNPEFAQQALLCLDMMDFDRKQSLIQKVAQNGMMYQQMMAVAQAQAMADASAQNPRGETAEGEEKKTDDGEKLESSITRKARQRVAESTAPR